MYVTDLVETSYAVHAIEENGLHAGGLVEVGIDDDISRSISIHLRVC